MGNPWDNPITASRMKNAMSKPHTLTERLREAARIRGQKRRGIFRNSEEIICLYCGKSFLLPLSRRDGRIGKNGQPQDRKYCSNECRWLASRKPDELKTDKVLLKQWSLAVLERDNYTCQDCGCQKKRLLQAHHKISKEDNPALTYDTDNGKTLCVYCHAKSHDAHLTNFILSAIHLDLRRPYVTASV